MSKYERSFWLDMNPAVRLPLIATGVCAGIASGVYGLGELRDSVDRGKVKQAKEVVIDDTIKKLPNCDPSELLVVVPRSKVIQEMGNTAMCKVNENAFVSAQE